MGASRNQDKPPYLPRTFEAEHGAHARRRVGASYQPWRHATAAIGRRASKPRQARPLAVFWGAHGLAAALAVGFAALTGTWLVGLVVLGYLAVSLAASLACVEVVRRAVHAERHRRNDSRGPREGGSETGGRPW